MTGTRLHLADGDPLAAAEWVDRAGTLLTKRSIPETMPALVHAQGLLQLTAWVSSTRVLHSRPHGEDREE